MSEFPKLKKGDIFLTVNPMALGKMINFISTIRSKDHKSKYTHAGIIIDEDGTTFESKWKISQGHISDYEGKSIVIYRNTKMTDDTFFEGMRAIKKFEGKNYPFHRLLYFMIPYMAEYVHFAKVPVCSELVCKFLYKAGFKLRKYVYGTTPDNLEDECRSKTEYKNMFEGKK